MFLKGYSLQTCRKEPQDMGEEKEDFPDLPEVCYTCKNRQAWAGCLQFEISD